MAYYQGGGYGGRYSSPADYWNEQEQSQRSNIQNVLNMMLVMKQNKMNQADKQQEQQRYAATQEQAQKKWGVEQQQQVIANQLAERGMVAEESRAESQRITAKRPMAIPISTQRQAYADSLLKSGELNPQEYQQFKLTGTLPKKEGLTTFQQYSKKSTEMGRSQSYVRNKITNYGRSIDHENAPMSQAELIDRLMNAEAYKDRPLNIDEVAIKNLESARSVLAQLESTSYDQAWTKDEKRILAYISGNREKIKKEGLRIAVNQQTGEKVVEINGKWLTYR
ncbi:hypothetical protein LCGC14_2162730 [marine sediment metagenome]|uniref:Uncharacterized protein n=1 Tax=marine sediment metagenome TaxID=412755 RepID=A0A0F9GNE0_9ZZZZ